METTTKRPGRLATIVATALFGALLAASAATSLGAGHDVAGAVKPQYHKNMAGGGKPVPNTFR
jgi:hypothetical protein